MKTIIAGSRTITDFSLVEKAVKDSGFEVTEVVCGEAKGADSLGKQWAKRNQIPVKSFPAQWEKFGKSAGYKRNKEMAEYGEALILLWDGVSKGSANMKKEAESNRLKVFVFYS